MVYSNFIPNWILLIIASWLLSKKGKSVQQIKTISTIISIGLTLTLSILVVDFGRFPVMWWASLFFSFTVSVSIQFYHLKNVAPKIVWLENILDDKVVRAVCLSDIPKEHRFEYSGKWYAKLKVNKNRDGVSEYGKSHYITINEWKPEAKEPKPTPPVAKKEEEDSPDLPF